MTLLTKPKYETADLSVVVAGVLAGSAEAKAALKIRAQTDPAAAVEWRLLRNDPEVDLSRKGYDPNQPRDDQGQWTKAQVRAYISSHPVSAQNILAVYDRATPQERETGKNWYPNAHKIALAMSRREKISVREAAGMIAAYSPQTPWGRNLVDANEVLRTKKPLGGPGAHLDIVQRPGEEETRLGVMASGVNAKRAKALLAGTDFEEVFAGPRNKHGNLPPNSLKVRSFAELIAAGKQPENTGLPAAVVVDRHAAGVARGIRLTEDQYAIEGPSSSMRKYSEYAQAYRDAAALLTEREGREVTPEEVQATTWLTRQRLNNTEGRNTTKLGQNDQEDALEYFASYDPDIADIVDDPMTGYVQAASIAEWQKKIREKGDRRSATERLRDLKAEAGSKGRQPQTLEGRAIDEAFKGVGRPGRGTGTGTPEDPVNVHGNVMLAARLIGEGKHVRLNKVDEVGSLLSEIDRLVKDAKARGVNAPNYDLCRISVPKTNLFCAKSKGIPRVKMPQLSGVPKPGSKGDSLPKSASGEIDVTDLWETTLREHGVKVRDTTLPAHSLKATQDQLIGPKVAGLSDFMEKAPADSRVWDPIFVTRDHYVIDGHHRWAARVAQGARTHEYSKIRMNVREVDLDIGEALAVAQAFADEYGLGPAGFETDGGKIVSLSTVDLAYDPNQPRDRRGRWAKTLRGVIPAVPGARRSWTHRATVERQERVAEAKQIIQAAKAPGYSGIEEAKRLARVNAQAEKAEAWARAHPPVKAASHDGEVFINGEFKTLDEAYDMVSEAYDWDARNEIGGGDPNSIRAQGMAQIVASAWDAKVGGDDPVDDQYAASMWHEYQSPDLYGKINGLLRGYAEQEPGDPSPEDVRKYADEMFAKGGYTTTQPTTMYRALKSGHMKWTEILKEGSTFNDKGIVSMTAGEKFAEGWLTGDADETGKRKASLEDVVLEIKVPEGQRIVGGNVGFVESMLPPNTTLRVISSMPDKAMAVNPITGKRHRIEYTRVVAEVVPNV